jgi:hypothetical protein
MKKVVFLFLISLSFPLLNIAEAQSGKTGGPRFFTEFKPVVGGWSEYQMILRDGSTMKLKIAIVGKEGDAYWFENMTEGGREGRVITKILVSGDPKDTKHIKRFIVKTGNEPAMEIPSQMMGQAPQAEESKGKMIEKGTEAIKVPAGAFTTQHLQYQEGDSLNDIWVHKDIPPYGVVKSKSKDAEMVLLGYGAGATTQIKETPQKFQMPQMPPIKR